MRSKLVLTALFLAAIVQVFPQTAPDALQGGTQLFVGGGVSVYDANYFGDYPMEGGTIWADFFPNRGPALLHGLGVEAEARDISLGRPSNQPSNLREDTGGGGAIYSWRHFHHFSPYAKFQWEHASIDFRFQPPIPNYNHDTRDLYAGGVGVDYRVGHNIWVRAGYEQQYWQWLFHSPNVSAHTGLLLKPSGVTVGASYEFRRHHLD
jgi:opacity protein-like surface antigen